jgi:hypothetical protein
VLCRPALAGFSTSLKFIGSTADIFALTGRSGRIDDVGGRPSRRRTDSVEQGASAKSRRSYEATC